MQVRFEFEQINRILKDVKNIFVQESVPVVPVLTKYGTLKEAEENSEEWTEFDNAQFLCTVNGEKKQGVDVNHRLIRLEQKPGQKVSVWLMGHSGFKEEKSMFYVGLQRRDLLAEKFRNCMRRSKRESRKDAGKRTAVCG